MPVPGVPTSAAPAHRVQLARALADGLVAALIAGDVEGSRMTLRMLATLVETL
jgi:hypothetical protein